MTIASYLNSTSPSHPPTTTDLSSSPTPPPCPVWPSLPQSVLIPILYTVICILGVVGNTLAVCVLAQGGGGRSRRTVANTFMLNLCVSDLLFLLSLPLWAVYYSLGYRWPFGRLACKLCGGLLALNLYASIFFITCMSVDRYLAIVHPLRSQSTRNPWRARLTCALVWALACASSAPTMALRDTHRLEEERGGVEACVILFPHQGWLLGMAWMKMLLGFLLPMAIISSCYCAIACHLLAGTGRGRSVRHLTPSPASKPQEPSDSFDPASPGPALPLSPGQKHPESVAPEWSGGGGPPLEGRGVERVLWTVAAVVLAFFLCWFPFHLLTLLHVLLSMGVAQACWVHWALDTLLPLSLSLGFANSAINPLLYCFLGNHFRGRLGGLWWWEGPCAVCVRGGARGGGAYMEQRGSFSTRLSFSRKLSDLKDLGGSLEAPGPA